MLHQIAGFCRRLFNSKGFQLGLRIVFGVYVVFDVYSVIRFITTAMDIGFSFGEALLFYFDLPFISGFGHRISASIVLGIIIGLFWHFSRKRKNREKDEPDEKAEESSDANQEEEIIETTHYRFR